MIPVLIVIGILILAYFAFFLENRIFTVRHETISHANVKDPFTVVQISDLHNARFGAEQQKLLAAIADAHPDLILITGDLFDRHRKHACSNTLALIKGVVRIAPTFFAEGNHEIALGEAGEKYVEMIRDMGVTVLRDEYVDLLPARVIGLKQYAPPDVLTALLTPERLNLVMAHRPERFPVYASTGADVILSGHAHGGQIRLFGIGVYAPQQGFFPKYTCGLYPCGQSLLHVSRGLGNTILFPRVFNTPELNILEFKPIK